MRKNFIFILILLSVFSCKKKGESVATEKQEEKARELGAGPEVAWKVLEDVPGSKPSHRGFFANYAVSGVPAMDSAEVGSAKKFFSEFKKPMEMLQSEDVLVSNSKVTAFFVRQYCGSGKEFYSHFFTRYYDSKSGKRLAVKDFFNNAQDFAKFAALAKNAASVLVKRLINEDNDVKADERALRLQNFSAKLNAGFTADIFANTVFDDKFATIVVPAGKIAEADYGKILVRVPIASVEALLNDDFKDYILSQNSAKFLAPPPLEKQAPVAQNPADSIAPKSTGPENVIALTFDDGPCNYTLQLLDILKEKKVKATFFVVGKMAEHYKPILKRIHAEGHQIANHSWNHADFRKLSLREVRRQLDDTNAQIFDASGQLPSVFRPPYGASNPMVKAVSDMPIMLWNIDPLDWKIRNTPYTLQKMSRGGPEDIVLGHDIHITTVQAVPQLIENLRAKNLKFVTVDELFAGYTLKVGKQYAQKHRPGFYRVTIDQKPAPKKK